jgi:integrase/recombinase XerC
MSNELVPSPTAALVPAPLFAPTPKAAKRVLEFFASQISNDHTRKAYMNATRRFAVWCEARGIRELAGVEPVHVAAFIKKLEGQFTPPPP